MRGGISGGLTTTFANVHTAKKAKTFITNNVFTVRTVVGPADHILRTADLDIRVEHSFCTVSIWLKVKNSFLIHTFSASCVGRIQLSRLCVVRC